VKASLENNGMKVSIVASEQPETIAGMCAAAFNAAIGYTDNTEECKCHCNHCNDDTDEEQYVPDNNVGNISNTENIIPINNNSNNSVNNDTPLIRGRIPNNVVDPETLTYKKAIVENALVRCPNCGQAHILIAKVPDGLYVMRKNFVTKNFDIITKIEDKDIENLSLKEGVDHSTYFFDVLNLKIDPEFADKDIAVDNDTLISCPICQSTSNFKEWKKAYDQPLDYFETEQLCDSCGGELTMLVSKPEREKLKAQGIDPDGVMQCETCNVKFDKFGIPISTKH
jgi:hypothetical protein